jgi:hypothetical protein
MISAAQIEEARRHIADRFLNQCIYGEQTRTLPLDVKACGQFLHAKGSPHRGIYGTAAAIRVLAEDERPEVRRLLPELIKYAQNRRSIEESLLPVKDKRRSRLNEQILRDDGNVIKVSELLFALASVQGAIHSTQNLAKELADRLMTSKIDPRGWGYFLDQRDGDPQLLPTAHAVRALAKHGYDVSREAQFLENALTPPALGAQPARADISVRVFCLFVLCFLSKTQTSAREEELRQKFRPIWRALESLLNDDIEQNIEYARKGVHFYVRVPWQLYLLALACRLAPLRSFASHAAQSRLESIVKAVAGAEGFLYPHSGEWVSSRTNAILYDVLEIIGDQQPRSSALLLPALAVDRARKALNSTIVIVMCYATAAILMGLSIYQFKKQAGGLKELAPNFLSWIVLLLLTARKSR